MLNIINAKVRLSHYCDHFRYSENCSAGHVSLNPDTDEENGKLDRINYHFIKLARLHLLSGKMNIA